MWQERGAGTVVAGEKGTGMGLSEEKMNEVNFPGLAGFSRWLQSHCGCLCCCLGGDVVCSDSGSCC